MADRNTLVRTLHDVGLAAWFGGSLMGAIGLNGAGAAVLDDKERRNLSERVVIVRVEYADGSVWRRP